MNNKAGGSLAKGTPKLRASQGTRLLTLGRLAVQSCFLPLGLRLQPDRNEGLEGHVDIAPLISTRMSGGCRGNEGPGAGRWERGPAPKTRLGLRPAETGWFLAGRRRPTGVLPCPAPHPTELSPLLSGAAPRPHFPALHFGERRQARAGEQEPLAQALVKTQAPEV